MNYRPNIYPIARGPVSWLLNSYRSVSTIRATLVVTALLGVFSGCAERSGAIEKPYSIPDMAVSVDYLSDGAESKLRGSGKTYSLVSVDGAPSYDLQYKKNKELIERVLNAIGLKVALESRTPEMTIFFKYGMGEVTRVNDTSSLPIYGQTGISSATTTGTIGPGGSISATTAYTPAYGVIGYSHTDRSYSLFSYNLVLETYETNSLSSSKPRQIWKALVSGTGKISDKDIALRSLLVGVKKWVGVDLECTLSYAICSQLNSGARLKPRVDVFVNGVEFKNLYDPIPDPREQESARMKAVIDAAKKGQDTPSNYDVVSQVHYAAASAHDKLKAARLQATFVCGGEPTSVVSTNERSGGDERFIALCADGKGHIVQCTFAGGQLNVSGSLPMLDRKLSEDGLIIGSVNACWVP